MTVLVTGATGGLAADILQRFASNSVADIVRSGRRGEDTDTYIQCDLSNQASVRALIFRIKPKLVLHLAGSFLNSFDQDLPVNALSAGWMAEAVLEAGIDTRLLLVGSAAEYGFVTREDNPIPESHPLRPVSPYGLTKVLQTQIGGYYAKARGADIVVARLFNVVGPGLSTRLFVGRAEQQIVQFRLHAIPRLEFGNLDSERDYLTTHAAARLIALVAERGVRGEVYNVGSGHPLKMRTLLRMMLEDAGIPDAPFVELPVSGRGGSVDVDSIYADISKLRSLEDLKKGGTANDLV
jgi:GDP-4-dehydro-6-deoxy-D-mannose reductase